MKKILTVIPIKSQLLNLFATIYFVVGLTYSSGGHFILLNAILLMMMSLGIPYVIAAALAAPIKILSKFTYQVIFTRCLMVLNILLGMTVSIFVTGGLLMDSGILSIDKRHTSTLYNEYTVKYQNIIFRLKKSDWRAYCAGLHSKQVVLYPTFVKHTQHGRGHLVGVIIGNCTGGTMNLGSEDVTLHIEKRLDNQRWQTFKDITALLKANVPLSELSPGYRLIIDGFSDGDNDMLDTYRFVLRKGSAAEIYSSEVTADLDINQS